MVIHFDRITFAIMIWLAITECMNLCLSVCPLILFAIVLSNLLWFTSSCYPFGKLKNFLQTIYQADKMWHCDFAVEWCFDWRVEKGERYIGSKKSICKRPIICCSLRVAANYLLCAMIRHLQNNSNKDI